IRLEEFDVEKEWWKTREESEFSWKINLSIIIEKAVQDAKPHYDREKEFKREAYSLKEKITKLKREDKTNGDLDELQKKLQEAETNTRLAKQTADSIYYGAFDLNYKNPNGIAEDDDIELDVLIEKIENSFKDSSAILLNIKNLIG